MEMEQAKKLVKRSLTQFRLPYLTLTPTFSVCPTHGYQNGEQPECPICGAESQVWSRVMGYHRPVTSYNKGKKAEYDSREVFQV
jgi:ribonucleoside-triphosphate reductase